MSYDNAKLEIGREHIYIVDLLLSYCSLTHGTAPCTATGTGDARCYNTFDSCQDTANYTAASTLGHFRFYQSRSPAPIGLAGSLVSGIDPIPNLLSVNISPAKLDVSGGLGVRSSVTCTFTDHPYSDIGVDKYVDGRTYIASDKGSFWTKLRARNPNYQNRSLRVLSGYLENGVFDINNFETRYYIVDSMNVTDGKCTIVAKDPLKLAGNKKAQAPAPSNGLLQSAINSAAGSLTLTPAGVGNAEYPASGKVLIKSEVMSFTRAGDVLTLTRAQNNTIATDHSANDTVQLCLEYNGEQVNDIVKDLLVNYANIDASYIDDTAWQAEINTYLSGLLTGIVVKPFDVFKLLKELAESMPHYLWWDEKLQVIQLTALKAPPLTSDVLDMDGNIINLTTKDNTALRASTIFVNFGQFDPTKKLDEPGNYQQTHARIDGDSIAKYNSNKVKVINSRWISNTNKAAALQLAALIGRRFSDNPREVSFKLDAKDSDVWIGQSRAINHRDIVDFAGDPIDTIFQITSSKESKNFDYSGLEFTYGEVLPEDEGGGEPGVDLVLISIDSLNVNLRTIYDGLFPAPSASTEVKFIIDNGVKVGSSSIGSYGLDTGSWPAGATVTLQLNINSYSLGKGGTGATVSVAAEGGGDAIILNHDLTLVNNGVIGGGGGGGGYGDGFGGRATGGGGAGFNVGEGGGINDINAPVITNTQGANGTTENGGAGGLIVKELVGEPEYSTAANGGDLGQDGGDSDSTGGTGGDAIHKNGFTLIETVTGDIRGSIVA